VSGREAKAKEIPAAEMPPSLVACIERAEGRWRDAEGIEESTLLRLAILRELVRELHAEKSKLLARGARPEAQALKVWEKKIEDLKGAASFGGTLAEAIRGDLPTRKRTRLLPESLFHFLPKEKLERYDRVWESAIAAEAATLGWRFWSLTAWVQIHQAEEWHRALSDRLIPHGVLLFAESADAVDAAGNLWQGQWLLVLKPRFSTPDFRVRELPGVSLEPAAPLWKLLYSPKQR